MAGAAMRRFLIFLSYRILLHAFKFLRWRITGADVAGGRRRRANKPCVTARVGIYFSVRLELSWGL